MNYHTRGDLQAQHNEHDGIQIRSEKIHWPQGRCFENKILKISIEIQITRELGDFKLTVSVISKNILSLIQE